MCNIKDQYLRIKPEIDEAIQEVIDSGQFINGSKVGLFAYNLSLYLGGGYVIPCANGTDALQIALMSLHLNPGDEVIIPSFNYVAAAEVTVLLGLTPVFCDADPATFNINSQSIEDVITKKSRVIIVTHLFGQCCNMDLIRDISITYGLQIIEDCAQSLGSEYNGFKAGTFGIISCFSFFPSKNLGCFGDGGAIFTNDEAIANEVRIITNHGQEGKYNHTRVGVNSRLDTIQAAILDVKLKYLDDYIKRRQEASYFYYKHIKLGSISPPLTIGDKHTFNQFTIRTGDRAGLITHLAKHNIQTAIYYPTPLHRQPAYRQNVSLPVSEQLSKTVLSLPMNTELTDDELYYICKTINNYFK